MLRVNPSDEPAVLLAHAWRLSSPALVHHGPTPLDSDVLSNVTEIDRLAGLLRRELQGMTVEDARRWTQRALREAQTEWESLRTLAERCVCFEAGRPAARVGALEHRLRGIVQADALVCWHLAQRGWSLSKSGIEARVGWAATLPPARNIADPLLGRAMAENHCHLGSAVSTAVMWVFALCGDDPAGGLFSSMADPSAPSRWGECLRLARAQVLCIERLSRPRIQGDDDDASDASEVAQGVPAADLLELRRVLGWSVRQTLQQTPDRTEPPWRMTRLALDSERLQWPLGEWVIGGTASLSVLAGERLLVWRAMRSLPLTTRPELWRCWEQALARALLGYLRIKNAFHLMLQDGPRGRGFFAFDRIFKRRSFFSAAAKGAGASRAQMSEAREQRRIGLAIDAFLEDALGHGGTARQLHLPPLDLELRVAPERGPCLVRTLRAWLRGIRDAMERWRQPKVRVGLVLHAIKTREPYWWEGLRVQMEGLRFMMADQPALCRLIVGIDAAGVERLRPPRECALFFRTVRQDVQRQDPAAAPIAWRPGFTFHVGEDFPDLLTGLRHIDEAAHLLGLRPNDRLGHALALGWDIEAFYETAQRPSVSLRERVLDLLWLLHLAAEGGDGLRDQAFWLRREIVGLVVEARRSRGGESVAGSRVDAALHLVGEHYRERPFKGEAELLIELGIPPDRWEDEIAVPAENADHRRCVHEARRLVWQRVHHLGLFIEGNPTSNLIIGGLNGYSELPMMRQGRAPGVASIDDLPALRVTINTDNPGIFNTTLRGEYVRLAEALLARGSQVDAMQVVDWLDVIRRNGLAASFIPDDVPRGQGFVELLNEVLDADAPARVRAAVSVPR